MRNPIDMLEYVDDFAALCEGIHHDEVSGIVPKIFEVLPHILESEFGLSFESIKDTAKECLDSHRFDDAIFSLIPNEIIVSSRFGRPRQFVFSRIGCRDREVVYQVDAPVYSMALLSAFLKFLNKSRRNSKSNDTEFPNIPTIFCLDNSFA